MEYKRFKRKLKSPTFKAILKNYLYELYHNTDIHDKIIERVNKAAKNLEYAPKPTELFTEKDNILITYADQVKSEEINPLSTLAKFTNDRLSDTINITHLLPFFPWTSDDGFSVSDYKKIKKEYGDWEDLAKFKTRLMYDGVFNHLSVKSEWFKQWISGNEEYKDFFISFSEEEIKRDNLKKDLQKVVRPRTSPLLTEFSYENEKKYVWTTFSEDQVDINLSNPKVLYKIIDVLLFYYENYASVIRIDAVPFFWKELGTNCSHHPKTHIIVKTLRLISEYLNKNFLLISESNVPHKENIEYFGNGSDEAHVVYNFSLPALIILSNVTGKAKDIHNWSKTVSYISDYTTFFNITATHDGIGLRPLEGIVSKDDIEKIVEVAKKNGSKINYKNTRDGGKTPYELNTTWTSFMYEDTLNLAENVEKITSSHIASYAFPGIPGIYFHNLLATLNWDEGVSKTKQNRTINRRKFDEKEINNILSEKNLHSEVFKMLMKSLKIKNNEKCFHPLAKKIDFFVNENIWSFIRMSMDDNDELIVVMYNLSEKKKEINLDFSKIRELDHLNDYFNLYEDILSPNKNLNSNKISFRPYQIRWIKYRGVI